MSLFFVYVLSFLWTSCSPIYYLFFPIFIDKIYLAFNWVKIDLVWFPTKDHWYIDLAFFSIISSTTLNCCNAKYRFYPSYILP